MGSTRRSFTRAGNRFAVWLYRSLDGRLSSGSRDVTVLMVTSAGRRTGRPRSTCVRYLTIDEGFVVWGTGSGSRRDPDWFQNLRAQPTAEIRIRARRLTVHGRELHDLEKETMWRDVVLAAAPEVAKYQAKAGRVIPVAVLQPVTGDHPGG